MVRSILADTLEANATMACSAVDAARVRYQLQLALGSPLPDEAVTVVAVDSPLQAVAFNRRFGSNGSALCRRAKVDDGDKHDDKEDNDDSDGERQGRP